MSNQRLAIATVVRKYREAQNFSYRTLAYTLNVREEVLRDLEAGRLTKYSLEEVKRVLKRFSYVCELDSTRVLELCEAEYQARRTSERGKSEKAIWLTPRHLQWLVVALLFIAGVGYVGLESYKFARDPSLTLSQSQEFETVDKEQYTLTGSVNPGHTLKVNGTRVNLSSGGAFELNLRLRKGYNTLRFEVQKPSGQTQTKMKILYHT